MATFGLVHGGFHGAWCWDRLIPELTARGHDAVAMDMPIDDPDATLSDYVDAVVDSLAQLDQPIILVGHSMGGLVIPHVAQRRPVARLVFLCAMFDNLPDPDPSVSIPTVERRNSLPEGALRSDGTMLTVSAEGAAAGFYPDCDPADAAWAVAHLRPLGRAPSMPLVAPWPDVPFSIIICTDDASAEHTRMVVAPQVGVEPIELPGGHSPFLSRPSHLADVLDELSR